VITLSLAEARRLLVSHVGLNAPMKSASAVLQRLGCIQLDPLDVIGTNADLVLMARVPGARRGDVYSKLFPRGAFEHFAKERCILPAAAFPFYRQHGHGAQTPWWRHQDREQRVPATVVARVLTEVRERGPITARDLTDHGAVEPMDWSGWKGTAKATSMALEILWTTCDVVISGRTASGAKLYDVPERALKAVAAKKPDEPFERWALRERVRAAGLLSRSGGATWSILNRIRTTSLPDEMIASGELIAVSIDGSPRRYLAAPEFLRKRTVRYDDRIRIIGPLDPLIWDRDLVRHIFEFDYVWEVYKPAKLRKWGWYVCPLLYRDRLVGRVDATNPRKVWIEGEVERVRVNSAIREHMSRLD
jgi:uncharacterized protein YcaQ